MLGSSGSSGSNDGDGKRSGSGCGCDEDDSQYHNSKATSMLNSIRGVTYQYNEKYINPKREPFPTFNTTTTATKTTAVTRSSITTNSNSNNIGVIAQEVLTVLPEAVSLSSITNTYGVDYLKLIPVVIESVKEIDNRVVSVTANTTSSDTSSSGSGNEYNSVTNVLQALLQEQSQLESEHSILMTRLTLYEEQLKRMMK